MLILVVTVLFSRLYLQVHYPGDVIAGAVLGIICVVASFALFRKRLK
jgi:membrane-associated phospholipid phosphatase